jgi:hypothetical protein
MVVRGKRRRCRFCNQLFAPDPRLKGRQIACSAPDCQRRKGSLLSDGWGRRCSVEESGPPLLYVVTLLSLTWNLARVPPDAR